MALSATSRLLLTLGWMLGLAGATLSLVFWAVLVYGALTTPGGGGATGMTFVVAAIMVALALVVVWAALKARPLVLLLAFAGSLFPVGFYLMLTPGGWWIGVGNLLYLFAGAFVCVGRLTAYGSSL